MYPYKYVFGLNLIALLNMRLRNPLLCQYSFLNILKMNFFDGWSNWMTIEFKKGKSINSFQQSLFSYVVASLI